MAMALSTFHSGVDIEHMHMLVQQLCFPGHRLHEQLSVFVEGGEMDELPALSYSRAQLRGASMVETGIERTHKDLKEEGRRLTANVGAAGPRLKVKSAELAASDFGRPAHAPRTC